jgi:hypothetical protein
MYRYDFSYALDVFAAYPSRFRLVKPWECRPNAGSRFAADSLLEEGDSNPRSPGAKEYAPCPLVSRLATGIFCAAARQFNYCSTSSPCRLPRCAMMNSHHDDEQPPLTSNFTDLTIN